MSLRGQGNCIQGVLMRLDCLGNFLLKYVDSDGTLFAVGRSEDCVVIVGIEGTKASGVVARVNSVNQSQVSEVVHVDAVFEDDYNSKCW